MPITETPNVICAWCGAALGYKPDLPPGTVSHGICQPCVQVQLATLTPRAPLYADTKAERR